MKKIGKIILIGLLFVNSLGINVQAVEDQSEPTVGIYLDGKKVAFAEDMGEPFIDSHNRVQIPFRGVLEAIGATVTWDQKERTAIGTKEGIEVQVEIGKKYIKRNGEVIIIDAQAIIIQGRTYIPVRAVLEAFGAQVVWEQATRDVKITTEKGLSLTRLPAYYDLRETGRLTSVKDQKDIGACWAFATTGALESRLSAKAIYDFSEDHLSLTHGYSIPQNEGGDFQISLAYLARWSGPVYEEEDPYGDQVSPEGLEAAVHIQEAIILPEKDYSAIKRNLIQYGGIQTAIHIKSTQDRTLGETYNDKTAAYAYLGTEVANHEVLIVGWDDTYPVENFITQPREPGAFIVKNSYGTDFGEDGFFYISYEDMIIGKEAVVYTRIEDRHNHDYIYQSDWLGWVGSVGYGKDAAYFSNIYTTRTDKEWLEAVGFYATGVDTTYEIYIVQSFDGVESFSKKEFVTRGSLNYKGYYTIDFDKPMVVEGDYSVVVKIRTPGSLLPVAAEYGKEKAWLKDLDLSDGRGYMSYDGEQWEDTEEVIKGNMCLKAFTSKVQ